MKPTNRSISEYMICIYLITLQVIKCKRYFYAQPKPASAVTAATMSSSYVLVPG